MLRTLSRRELVVERLSSSIGDDVEYAFKHVLTRDVAYESLPRRQRAQAHAAAAEWIEHVSGERAGELVEVLAHHYDAAYSLSGEEPARERARDCYVQAARHAIGRFAVTQAERFAGRASELATPGAERASVHAILGRDVYQPGSLGGNAWRAYLDAIAELGGASPIRCGGGRDRYPLVRDDAPPPPAGRARPADQRRSPSRRGR